MAVAALRRIPLPELKTYHATMLVTRIEEWCVEAESPEEARELLAAGFEVGAHTVNHAILSRVPKDEAEREILGSRDRITSELGSCSPTFCYPNGKRTDYTQDVMAICEQHFHTALSAESGVARIKDRFELRRVGVDNATSPEYLASLIVQAE